MESFFLEILNLSITASWVIAIVLLLRLLLRPVPKKYVCLLWLVVLFRLLCPVTLESAFSLVPQHEPVRPEIVFTTPQVQSHSEVVNDIANKTVNPILQQHSAPNPLGSVNPLQVYLWLAARLWVLGIVVLCGYTLASWLRLKRQLREAVPDGEGVYLCDAIASPFVFGIARPRIYLPFGLDADEQRWVLLHERSHIARKDFLLKPLFWLAVLLHWMNPLVWVAWHFYSRDMELACDERAIESLNDNQKWCYSNTLLQLAVQKTSWSCPVAFGNNSVKQRIQHVLRYKQAAVGMVAVAVAVIVMMMAALGVNPVQVYQLDTLRPELHVATAEIDHAALCWGSAVVEVTEQAQIQQLQQALAAVQVKKTGKSQNNLFHEEKYYVVPVANAVRFIDAAGQVISYFGFNGDCSQLDPLDQDTERCAYLAVQQPKSILSVFAQYGAQAQSQLTDTTFFADLDQDGAQERIVVDPGLWEKEGSALLAVYRDDGTVLYSADLNRSHAGWGNYFLYQRDGQDYLLEYSPYMGQGYATYNWRLLQFDQKGKPVVVEQDSVDFSINPEQYQFDVEAIEAFLEKVDGMLAHATLLVSTENGELQYSTVQQPLAGAAVDYLDWLDETAYGYRNEGTLSEKLQRLQHSVYFERPQVRLMQWLKYHQGVDTAQQELTEPALREIDGVRCVSFELHWREDSPMQGRLVAIYAITTQDPDDFVAEQRGSSYYQYNQANDEWMLLETDAQQEDLSQLADQWAQSWADRDGGKRYARMSKALQQQVDQCVDWENTEQWEDWMPMWVTGENGQKGMFLRGSSPWVEGWQVTLQMPELSSTGKQLEPNLVTIAYDMMDSGQEHYVYEEQLQCEQSQGQWQVTACTATNYLPPELYVAAQQIRQNVLNGHDTWRLDPEQVAMAFVRDYLGYEGGHVGAFDTASNTVRYWKENGEFVEIALYQPLRHGNDPTADFWAVAAYQYLEGDKVEQSVMHYDVGLDLWASLHIDAAD